MTVIDLILQCEHRVEYLKKELNNNYLTEKEFLLLLREHNLFIVQLQTIVLDNMTKKNKIKY